MKPCIAPRILFAAAFSLSLSGTAVAGPYGDSLTKCLVQSTTSADKTTLVNWIFSMVTLHPQVSAMSTLTKEDRTKASKDTAMMLQTLLTKTCLKETREALKYEGPSVLEASFNQLGQIAARELFTNPAVAGGMAEFANFVDKKAMDEAFGPAK